MSFVDIPALGRKYQIGQQYDLNNDAIVSSRRVWSEDELSKCTSEVFLNETVITSCFPDELHSSLGIGDNSRLNLELGFFKPEGVARILQNERYRHRGRIRLQHYYLKSVSVSQHNLFQLRALYSNGTHVIAGITYGCTVLSWHDETLYSSDGVIYNDLSEEVATGDFRNAGLHIKQTVRNNPAKAVPLKYHLWPNPNKRAFEIRPSLLSQVVALFEHHRCIGSKCAQLLASPDVTKTDILRGKIDTFKTQMQIRREQIFESIADDIKEIRSQKKAISDLEDFLQTEEKSPFSPRASMTWLQIVENEIKIIEDTIKEFPNSKCCRNDFEFQKYVKKHAQIIVVVILCPESDPILQQILQKAHQYIAEDDTIDRSTFEEKKRQFQIFHKMHQHNPGIHFCLYVDKTKEQNMDVAIHIYRNGKLSDETFHPPSKPEYLMAENVSDTSFCLSWQLPDGSDFIESYEVLVEDTNKRVSTYISEQSNISVAGLVPSTEYHVKVCSYRAQIKSMYSRELRIKTTSEEVSSPPGRPNIVVVSSKMMKLQWTKPVKVKQGKIITHYRVYSTYEHKRILEVDGQTTEVELPILPNKKYQFTVRSKCGNEKSKHSPCSEEYERVMKDEDLRKETIKEESKLLKEGTPSIYLLPIKQVSNEGHVKKFEYGKPSLKEKEKIVMLLGATGSGKSTLINSIANYVLGISWTDEFRVRLVPKEEMEDVQTESQTKYITSFTIHYQKGFRFPFTLTLVDTPGFGDTSGIKRDKEIIKQMTDFFSLKTKEALDHIDAIGFVAQSSLPRLTATQRYIFDSILALFGKDISANIFPLLTFADAQTPQILGALMKAKIPCQKYFKMNNSALIAENGKDAENAPFDKFFWKMGEDSYKVFLNAVLGVEPKSLSLTKEVLTERERLETQIESIRLDIDLEMNKIEQLKKEFQVLEQHKWKMYQNEDLTYYIDVDTIEVEEIPAGKHVTNCIVCNRTCHYPCYIPNDGNKKKCVAMDKRGNCTNCSKMCIWNMHRNMPYRYVKRRKKVEGTMEQLKKKYQLEKRKQISQEELLERIAGEIEDKHLSITQSVFQARKCIVRLHEIALKPNPLSTVDYVALMIDAEKQECQPGWQERVAQLIEVQRKAVYIESIAEQDFDPFKNYSGLLQQVKDHFAGMGKKILIRLKKMFLS